MSVVGGQSVNTMPACHLLAVLIPCCSDSLPIWSPGCLRAYFLSHIARPFQNCIPPEINWVDDRGYRQPFEMQIP